MRRLTRDLKITGSVYRDNVYEEKNIVEHFTYFTYLKSVHFVKLFSSR